VGNDLLGVERDFDALAERFAALIRFYEADANSANYIDGLRRALVSAERGAELARQYRERSTA